MQLSTHAPTSPPTKITQDYTVISPAYGRDYKSKAQAIADFINGLDFIIHPYNAPNTYCSIRDFAPNVKVNIRYKKLQQVCIYTVPEAPSCN